MFQILIVLAVLFALILMAMLVISALIMLAMVAAIGIPLWLMLRYWLRGRGLSRPAIRPIDQLRNLYVEGKIDLFEFERRVARLVAVEHH